jgi:hypothetical protein
MLYAGNDHNPIPAHAAAMLKMHFPVVHTYLSIQLSMPPTVDCLPL